jgi:uncharacterized damage-inducible protein DinB
MTDATHQGATNHSEDELEVLRFPIGRFSPLRTLTAEGREGMWDEIAAAPAALRVAVDGLDEAQLDTVYRPGGWTVRQVAHHIPDSHLNSYMRFKLTVTEDVPTIRTYDEAAWGELVDARHAPVDVSLALLDALHARWVPWLRSLSHDDYRRRLDHPELGEMDLDVLLQLYAWHGAHHVAHITSLRNRMGW